MKKLIALALMFLIVTPAFADFTSFDNDNPVVEPPKDEKVYNKLWMQHFRCNAPSPTEPAVLIAHFVPYDGAGSILEEPKKLIKMEDLFALASKRQKVAQAMELVFQALNEWMTDQAWFQETVQPLITKKSSGETLTDEELALIQQAKDKGVYNG